MAEPAPRRSYRVRILQTPEQWTAWTQELNTQPGENPHFARVRHIEATGETVVQFASGGFDWVCPGCGRVLGGTFGDEPVSGWDNPRWVNSGTLERPTLTPSLGCSGLLRGDCTGHWFLRDGELVPA
jgi:hypothetical protein